MSFPTTRPNLASRRALGRGKIAGTDIGADWTFARHWDRGSCQLAFEHASNPNERASPFATEDAPEEAPYLSASGARSGTSNAIAAVICNGFATGVATGQAETNDAARSDVVAGLERASLAETASHEGG